MEEQEEQREFLMWQQIEKVNDMQAETSALKAATKSVSETLVSMPTHFKGKARNEVDILLGSMVRLNAMLEEEEIDLQRAEDLATEGEKQVQD
ncbi:MAG: hypothetical protein Q9214_005708 [Letrouitia sp. 1 TL-2023]